MSKQHCVIVGGGHAGAQAIASLRQLGWEGEITLVCEEPWLPYNRPPLSKSFLSGEKTTDDLLIRPAETYEKFSINCLLETRVTGISPAEHRLELSDGQGLSYDRLLLCTGGSPVQLTLPGADLSGIHYLRNISDVLAIKTDSSPTSRVVIVGGGYIGLETAAMMTTLGMKVTLLEAQSRLLQRVTAPEVSDFFHALHQARGVDIHTGVEVSGFSGQGRVQQVLTTDGAVFDTDLVVVGIGIRPNTALAEQAGLATENGIVVDVACRTSIVDIFSAGDCTSFQSEHYKTQMRLESVQNAVGQAKVAAATICGREAVYSELPWFWSDQYEVKLQIAGLSSGYTDVILRGQGEPGDGASRFAAFYLRDDELLAVDAVNSPQDFMMGKRLIQAGNPVSREQLADEQVPLKELLSVK